MSVLAYAQGFTLWFYRHNGKLWEVTSPDFFKPWNDCLTLGDHIHIRAHDGGALAFVLSVAPDTKITLMVEMP